MSIVKLCGNRSEQDTRRSGQSDATHLGFIFVEGTKRNVAAEEVGRWVDRIQPVQKLAGVFVEPSTAQVAEVLKHVPLDIIQLHGNETVSEVLKMKETFAVDVWKAIHHDGHGQEKMELFRGTVDGYVIDAKVKGAHGGTGVTFDWEAVPAYVKTAKEQQVPCLIAGGITPANVAEVLAFHPDGVDVSSGTETNEAKDETKIYTLVKEVANHAARIS
ncbi:phosphoribosylanthranilate isomerase [Thalassobacillus hwangdonensis]|uniref:N-(5'-phosphoribosyl)anthranilate isomerase n=1 Tax=Thalassobacillus hwangdonensis TaxID=546108 RepID=A0ABW3L7I9_9BACI